jgi:SAM-dependent methyltransferase
MMIYPSFVEPSIKSFRFSRDEIVAASPGFQQWHEFVRRREAELLFGLLPGRRFERALEIGAGDGGQSSTIAGYCDHLICTELAARGNPLVGVFRARELPNVEYRLLDAQDMSQFADASFDLIFSSNVLEHVPDLTRCLTECRRVLKDDGLMIHSMPSRTWKLFNAAGEIVRFRHRPRPHGISRTNLREFLEFGRGAWISKFRCKGFAPALLARLPFYIGHGNRFLGVIKAGNALGLSASWGYVLVKDNESILPIEAAPK